MNLVEAVRLQEEALHAQLETMQAGVDDATGKGGAAEDLVERLLLRPFLPPGFELGKGAVVCSTAPTVQSGAIDRVIWNRAESGPLIYTPAHSVYPIEAVTGAVEVTLCLNGRKLRTDVESIARVQTMRLRCYRAPVKGRRVMVEKRQRDDISPRAFLVGLPEDPNWKAQTIAKLLHEIQVEIGWPTHVHALYVVGIGCFKTNAVEKPSEPMHRVTTFLGPQALPQFTDAVRSGLDRWPQMEARWTADLSPYIPGLRPDKVWPA